jgi:hypothetical protein
LLVGFIDSYWADDPNDQKSVVGYVFNLGSQRVTWACKKQQVISLSSTKVECQEVVSASQVALWLQQILS